VEDKPPLLAIHPQPLNGESCTSWLVRLAASNRIKPSTLLSNYVIKGQKTKTDYDRWSDSHKSNILALMAWDDDDVLNRTLLTRWHHSIDVPETDGYFSYPQSWLTSYTNTRYCPLCLAEDKLPHLRISWRLLILPICPKHRIFLQTGCNDPSCLYPNPNTRLDVCLVCAKCKTPFSHAKAMEPNEGKQAVEFIKQMEQMIESNNVARGLESLTDTKTFSIALLNLVQLMTSYLLHTKSWDKVVKKYEIPNRVNGSEYWRSKEPVTWILANCAVKTLREFPDYSVRLSKRRRYGLGWRQKLGVRGKATAEEAWEKLLAY